MSILGTNSTAPAVGRTAGEQAGFQLIALAVTLALAIVGGIVTGNFITAFVQELKSAVWEGSQINKPKQQQFHSPRFADKSPLSCHKAPTSERLVLANYL